MLPHDTLPSKLHFFLVWSSINILYLDLEELWGFTYYKTIGVSKKINFYRQRWTIAHEIWHIVYWDPAVPIWVPHWKCYQENRADLFAVNILLPMDPLLEEWERYEWDLNKLEVVFWVEKCIIEKRLKQFFKI